MHVPRSRTPRRAPALVTAALAAAALLTGAGAASGPAPAVAAPGDAQTVFLEQSFSGTDAGTDFFLPAAQTGSNVACLTAGEDPTATPIPGCAPGGLSGQGLLRLTDAGVALTGGVGSTVAVPVAQGLEVTFDSYQWGGTGADGIAFYLAAADPLDPRAPQQLGAAGGGLGYGAAAAGGVPGLENGYLGVGLDVYGNFQSNGQPECAPLGIGANSLTVRGPGQGTTGYCLLSTTPVDGDLRGSGRDAVPVQVAVNPSDEATATSDGRAVPARSWLVVVQGNGGQGPTVATGALPSLVGTSTDPSWYDPATGFPYKLTFGWTAGTGGATDVHEIGAARATSLLGAAPVLAQTTSGATTVVPTRTSTVQVAASVTDAGGDETEPVVTTTTFPTGLVPAPATSAGWTCTVSGQVETCTLDASPVAAGTDLPLLTLPYVVDATAASGTVTTVVSSVDAAAATGALDVTVAPEPTVVSGTSARQVPGTTGTLTTFGATVTSTATDAPTAPTGTADVVDADGAVLCTATLVPAASGPSSTLTCTADLADATATGLRIAYAGDVTHAASSAPVGTVVVETTPVALVASATPGDGSGTGTAAPGTVVLTATGLPAAATGTLTYTVDGAVACTTTLPTASCTVEGLAEGTHPVTIAYSGDGAYAAAEATTVATVAATSGGGTGEPGAGGPGAGAPGSGAGSGSGAGTGAGGSGAGAPGVDGSGAGTPVTLAPGTTRDSSTEASADGADRRTPVLAATGPVLAWTAGALGLALLVGGFVLAVALRRRRAA